MFFLCSSNRNLQIFFCDIILVIVPLFALSSRYHYQVFVIVSLSLFKNATFSLSSSYRYSEMQHFRYRLVIVIKFSLSSRYRYSKMHHFRYRLVIVIKIILVIVTVIVNENDLI